MQGARLSLDEREWIASGGNLTCIVRASVAYGRA